MEGNKHIEDHHHRNTRSSCYVGFENQNSNSSSSCTWAARKYCCSFCKREFRSAQALGGHMNVHRRDRARLRSSSFLTSWLSSHSPPPPPHTTTTTYDVSSSSPLVYKSPCLTLSCYSSLSSSATASIISGEKKPSLQSQVPPQSNKEIKKKINNTRSGLGVEEEGLKFKGCAVEDYDDDDGDGDGEHNNVLMVKKKKKNNIINEHNNNITTLELGIGLHNNKHPNEMLDLELRLGY